MNKKRILKFLTTGISAFLVEFSIFYILYYFGGFTIVLANILSFTSGLLISFYLNKSWVFTNNENYRSQLLKYILLALFNLVLSTLLISAINYLASPVVSKLFTVSIIAVWNYFIYKHFIFSYK
jgi:putative flippase GtrA